MITRTEKEICDQIDKASEKIEKGETFGSMTYEDGIRDALNWIMGYGNPPMDEE